MSRGIALVGGSTITAILRLEQSVCLAPMVLAFSAHLRRLTCLAVDEPADVVIGKTLRDTAGKHTLKFKAEAIIALGFVSVILCLLYSFT